jgi:acyl-CoA reductase-like NAD-dependent aldehyde dehydrogenase
VLTDVTTDMVITKEETFGPVAPLYRFKTEDDAVKMANDTPTPTLPRERGREGRGLASYFYSRDIGRISRVAEVLEYGIVGINEGIISPKSPLARSPPSAVATAHRLSRSRVRSSDRLFPHLDADLIPDDPQCIF